MSGVVPNPQNQNFSDSTLKGFLLKNVDPNASDPAIKELNDFLVNRVDQFWEDVVVPLRKERKLDGNKINWYFEIYKEGLEARKLHRSPFSFIKLTEDNIREIVKYYEGKTLQEYLDLGTSFLSNTYTAITAYVRDQLVMLRLQEIYSSNNPYDWIVRAEAEERGIMSKKPDDIPGLMDVIRNISIIMGRRV